MNINNLNPKPADLEEAVATIIYNITEIDKEEILKIREPASLHFSVGRSLRNYWKLWEPETPLVKYFTAWYGLSCGDDISSIILDAVICKVQGKPANTKELVERFKEHWEKYGK